MGLLRILLACCLASPALALAQACVTDRDCDDHVYCNGAEMCQPGAPGADARGCIAAPLHTACLAGQTCHEDTMRCETIREDRDGDGHASAATGGDDCSDNDANEFPGNAEVWDGNDHDEDCDARTHGVPREGDRMPFGAEGRTGPVQVCSGPKLVVMDGVVGGAATFRTVDCPSGSACISQPGGDGSCQAMAAGYVAPPVLGFVPTGDQRPGDTMHVAPMAMPGMVRPKAMPVAPSAVAVPPSAAGIGKACPFGTKYDVASGQCAAPACPPHTAFDGRKGACVPIPGVK